jgi:hypothetical protein
MLQRFFWYTTRGRDVVKKIEINFLDYHTTIPSKKMTYTKEITVNGDVTIEEITYDNMYNSTIIDIFQYELFYNQLEKYAREPEDYTEVTVYSRVDGENQLIVITLGRDVVLEKSFSIHHSSHMFHMLDEYEQQQEEEEDVVLEKEWYCNHLKMITELECVLQYRGICV